MRRLRSCASIRVKTIFFNRRDRVRSKNPAQSKRSAEVQLIGTFEGHVSERYQKFDRDFFRCWAAFLIEQFEIAGVGPVWVG